MRAAVTFPLIVLSLLIALAIGLPLGCAAVLTRNPRLRGLFHGIAALMRVCPVARLSVCFYLQPQAAFLRHAQPASRRFSYQKRSNRRLRDFL